MIKPMAYSIADVVKLSGVCRTVLYEEIKLGRLKARKLGRRTLILSDDLHHWLAALPSAEMEWMTPYLSMQRHEDE